MKKYSYKITVPVDVITFEDFIKHGVENAESMGDGVPWSFKYKGHFVTHETDDFYIIDAHIPFTKKDVLVLEAGNRIYPVSIDVFYQNFECYE